MNSWHYTFCCCIASLYRPSDAFSCQCPIKWMGISWIKYPCTLSSSSALWVGIRRQLWLNTDHCLPLSETYPQVKWWISSFVGAIFFFLGNFDIIIVRPHTDGFEVQTSGGMRGASTFVSSLAESQSLNSASTAQAGEVLQCTYVDYHHSWGTVDIWGGKAPPCAPQTHLCNPNTWA